MAQDKLARCRHPRGRRALRGTLDAGPGWDAFDHVREMVGGDVEILSVDVPCDGVDLMGARRGHVRVPTELCADRRHEGHGGGRPSLPGRPLEPRARERAVHGPPREHRGHWLRPDLRRHGLALRGNRSARRSAISSASPPQAAVPTRSSSSVPVPWARVIDDLGLDAGDVFVAMPGEAGPVRDDAPTNDEER